MYQLSQTLQTAIAAGNPQRVLIEFISKPDGTAYNPVRQFSNEDIIITNGVKLSAEFNSETDLTIGLCPSAEIQFDMLNDQSQLVDFEFGRFRAWLGARIDSGTPGPGAKTVAFTEHGATATYEFAPLGTFIAQRPDIVKKKTISVDANDLMTLFDIDMPGPEALGIVYSEWFTLSDLAHAMCNYVGVQMKPVSWLNSNKVVEEEPEQFESATMREVLGWIAEAACSNARFDRNALLEFAWFSAYNVEYDEHDYANFTPTWYATKAIDGLHIRNADSTSEFITGTGTNAYMIQDNPFLRQAGTEDIEEEDKDEPEQGAD